jgi:hypothetical protein
MRSKLAKKNNPVAQQIEKIEASGFIMLWYGIIIRKTKKIAIILSTQLYT